MEKQNEKKFAEDEFKGIRNNLLYLGGSVIAITSLYPEEGKTTVSCELARQLSLLDKKVLLVGGDMRRPSLHKALNIRKEEKGLSDILSSQEKIEPVKISDYFYVIESGKIPENPSELLLSSAFKSFIRLAKSKFDYVIIDTPPVNGSSDTQAIAKHTDGVVFVIRENSVTIAEMQKVKKDFESKGINIIGGILSRSHRSMSDSYYYKNSYVY